MAGETHGKAARIHLVGYDISNFLQSASADDSIDTAEISAFGDAAKRYLAGLEDGTFTADGNYAFVAGADDIRDAIVAAKASSDALLAFWPQGDAIGSPGVGMGTIETANSVTTAIADAAKTSISLQSNHGNEELASLHPMQAETGVQNFASVDNAASSAGGAVGYLQVPVSGTSVTVKIQHSTDNITFVDLITFTAAASNHNFQRVKVAGTVNRYLRAIISAQTAGPSTFAVGVGRTPVN